MTRTFSLPVTMYAGRNEAERAVLRAALAQRMQFDVARSNTRYGIGGRLALRCNVPACRGTVVFETRGSILILDASRSVMQHTCARTLVRVQRRILVALAREAAMRNASSAEIRAFLATRHIAISNTTLARVRHELRR
jgi:hypothetical protein